MRTVVILWLLSLVVLPTYGEESNNTAKMLDKLQIQLDDMKNIMTQNSNELGVLQKQSDDIKNIMTQNSNELGVLQKQSDDIKNILTQKSNELGVLQKQSDDIKNIMTQNNNELDILQKQLEQHDKGTWVSANVGILIAFGFAMVGWLVAIPPYIRFLRKSKVERNRKDSAMQTMVSNLSLLLVHVQTFKMLLGHYDKKSSPSPLRESIMSEVHAMELSITAIRHGVNTLFNDIDSKLSNKLLLFCDTGTIQTTDLGPDKKTLSFIEKMKSILEIEPKDKAMTECDGVINTIKELLNEFPLEYQILSGELLLGKA